MATPSMNDYYDPNLPRGKKFSMTAKWTTGATAKITAQPATNYQGYVSEVLFLASSDLAFTSGHELKITGVANSAAGSTDYILILNLAELINRCQFEFPTKITIGATDYYALRLKLSNDVPPTKITSDYAFSVENVDGAASAMTGTLYICVNGRFLPVD